MLPGGGHELHPADRAGGGDVQVAAVVGLDLVDRRQDLPAHAVLDAGGLVDRQQERRDPELVDEEVRDADAGRRRAGTARRSGCRATGCRRCCGPGRRRRVSGASRSASASPCVEGLRVGGPGACGCHRRAARVRSSDRRCAAAGVTGVARRAGAACRASASACRARAGGDVGMGSCGVGTPASARRLTAEVGDLARGREAGDLSGVDGRAVRYVDVQGQDLAVHQRHVDGVQLGRSERGESVAEHGRGRAR